MGKIAFISDIHGNFPALQAVWADIKSRGISEIYCLGDLVGYYCQINEVISFIRDNHIPCLMGNHDYALCYNEGKITRSKTCTSILKSQLSFISITNLYFLRTLPLSFHLSLESHSFGVCMVALMTLLMNILILKWRSDSVKVLWGFTSCYSTFSYSGNKVFR